VEATAEWEVPGDIGRRYAGVSGDRNPIHLHGLAAKLLGQKAAIAHGMWTKARCLAALQGHLPAAFSVDVAFKLPVLLPAMVAFSSWADGDVRRFALRDARSGRPHLDGSVSPSASPAA
jgi:acyl dehydratase